MSLRNAWKTNQWNVAWGLLFGSALGVRLVLAWGNADFLITYLLPDDAYYYFKIAENIVRGGGSTFDGLHLTNGYHPLWMGICVLVYNMFSAFPLERELPIHALLTISSLFDLGTVATLVAFLRRMQVRPLIRFFVCAGYLLNPWTVAHGLNGLESGLANMLLMITALLVVDLLSAHVPNIRKIGLFSAVSALTILARIDYVIFIALLGLYLLWKVRRGWGGREYAAVFLPGGILLGGWMAWSAAFFGTIIPQSGLAYTFVQKTLFFYKPRSWMTILAWSGYQWFRSLSLAVFVGGLSWLLWVCIGGGLVLLGKKMRERKMMFSGEGVMAVLLLGFIAYTFLQGAVRWSGREWYFSLGPLLAMLALGWTLQIREAQRAVIGGLAMLLAVVFFLNNPIIPERFANQQAMYRATKEFPSLLTSASSTRVGSYNAGIVGYYATQPIINLDGLVNIDAYHAIRDARMKAYLAEQGITHILDYEIAVRYRYAPFWGTSDLSFLNPVHVFQDKSTYNGSRLVLFEIR